MAGEVEYKIVGCGVIASVETVHGTTVAVRLDQAEAENLAHNASVRDLQIMKALLQTSMDVVENALLRKQHGETARAMGLG